MALFKRPDGVPTRKEAEVRRDQIIEQIEGLAVVLGEVRGDIRATSSVRKLQNQLDNLKQEISDKAIEKSRIEEEFARERREIEHHVGLERQRTDMEIEQAKKQAVLDVREENLTADKARFEEHMEFYKEQMDKHIDDVKLILTEVMTRVPTVNIDRKIRENSSFQLPTSTGASDGDGD